MTPIPLLVAAAALAPVLALPAQAAATPDSGPGILPLYQPTVLVLTKVDSGGEHEQALLRCDPPSGTHQRAWQACLALAEVNGHVGRMRDSNQVCTMEYNPIKVSVLGVWRGQTRSFSGEYSNPCVMGSVTKSVFSFEKD
ncbi:MULTISPECIES: subtilase-type protease inhibitor [Actinosynnema]|uniref:Protease inhibitor protein n=1 Tax=Actinosynnema pretiosum TaxID=42197 RepID=A0A290ZDL9_9PSEU|nr:subtilase-type protease inhibitor [Actinosynnema pretiosum]ATE57130.1 protease inhibitor protein [Actinosynnema pretiosum]